MAEGAPAESIVDVASTRVSDPFVASAEAVVAKILTALEARAAASDELRARRTYREWFSWVEDRLQQDPIIIGLVLGSALDDLAPELRAAHQLDANTFVDLVGFDVVKDGLLQSEWGVPNVCLRVVNCAKPLDLKTLGLLRRDVAVIAVAGGVVLDDAAVRLLEEAPLGVVEVEFARRAAPIRPAEDASGREARHRLTVLTSANLQDLAQQLLPTELERPVRLVAAARELGDLSRALSSDGAEVNNEAATANEAMRMLRADQQRLDRELRLTAVAATEVGGALKVVINGVKAARAEVEATRLLVEGRSSSFKALLDRVEVSSERLPDAIFEFFPRREWWRGTVFQAISFLWSKKDEIRLKASALRDALEQDRISVGRHLREIAVTQGRAFDVVLERGRKTFPTVAGALSNDQTGAIATSPQDLSAAMDQAVDKAFAEFAAAEARAIRIDREHKGLLGMLGEARSAVFAIFFIGALFLRAPWVKDQIDGLLNSLGFTPGDDVPGKLMGVMISLVVAAFVVNLLNVHRRDRALVAERIDGKIEEMGIKLISATERLAKDQLALLEAKLTERATGIDREFARRMDDIKARKEAQKVALAAGDSRTSEFRASDFSAASNAERLASTEREELTKTLQSLRPALLRAYRGEGVA